LSETKYRIPKLAFAVMVLGAHGCGDDDGGGGGSKASGTGRDGGTTTNTGRDGGISTGRDSGTSTGRDSGTSTGRDGGTTMTTPGAFDARYASVAADACKLVFSCEGPGPWTPEDDDEVSFSTERECVAMFQQEIKAEFAQAGDACVKAFLDYYECYIDLGCEAELNDSACEALYQTYYEACEDTL
jgi:hypothetical protein